MNIKFKVVIPARYEATRLPGKLLKEIAGKPLLQHVYDSAMQSSADEIIIATDSLQIKQTAETFGATVVMTDPGHTSGTDRIAEAVNKLGFGDDMIIINTQGDEFGLPAEVIDQLAAELASHSDMSMVTLCEPIIKQEDLCNPNIVKVVKDISGSALYFSRLPVPWHDDTAPAAAAVCTPYRHIGIYGYRAGFLKIFSALEACALESSEKLEQLRVLYHGYRIQVMEACTSCGMEINTPEDLETARRV